MNLVVSLANPPNVVCREAFSLDQREIELAKQAAIEVARLLLCEHLETCSSCSAIRNFPQSHGLQWSEA